MAVEVEELILQPFRDVVERAKEAIENAESGKEDEPEVAKLMFRSARSLVKEGERALQRLQPLWDGRVAQHGPAFTEVMRNNGKYSSSVRLKIPRYQSTNQDVDEILERQRKLEDLLYDLDDFVEIDTFDADRFSEVQAASKAFALNLLETIKRLKIDTPAPPSDILTPTSPATTWSHVPKLSQPALRRGRSKPPNCALPPTPGTVDEHRRRPSSPDILGAERESVRLVSQPTSPVTGPGAAGIPPPPTSHRISAWVNEQTAKTPWQPGDSIPENGVPQNETPITKQDSLVKKLDRFILQTSKQTINHPRSPETTGTRTSVYTESAYSTSDSYFSAPRTSAMIPSSDTRTTSLAQSIATSHIKPGTAVPYPPPQYAPPPQPIVPIEDFDTGLMLANESAVDVSDRRSTRSMTNRQMGVESTLYQLDGFCSGALTFRNQGHQVGTKGAMEYVSL